MGYTTFGSSLGFLDGSLKNSKKLLRESDRDFEYFARVSFPSSHFLHLEGNYDANQIADMSNALASLLFKDKLDCTTIQCATTPMGRRP